ncbi:MAG TPA: hypothetical protein VF397_09905 [Pyrinomonadaceae bacterium]
MELKNFEKQIAKTGFPLEHKIGSLLRASGWTVINNRYYVDDQEQNVREIDLVAYKSRPVQHFRVCTTLIISCKKSEQNVWALLARKKEAYDPNLDQQPVHIWTNDKALSFMLSKTFWPRDYYSRARELGVESVLADPSVSIFAFQEMNRESGSPQNDRPIFSSITGLMKAQSYEMEALPRRRKTPSIYQFNLVNLVDTQLVQLYFKDSGQKATEIEEEHYVARYIINKRETFARIHFVRSDKFETALEDYGRLHSANCDIFSKNCDEFYDGVLSDTKRTKIFLEEFEKEVKQSLWSRLLRSDLNLDAKLDGLWLYWVEKERRVEVMIPDNVVMGPVSDKVVAFLNDDKEAKRKVGKSLEKYYRYSGPFSFGIDDVPF